MAAIPLVEAFYEKYYERNTSLNRDEFVKGLHLDTIIFGPDGSISLWYGTLALEVFNGKDIEIMINSNFKVSEVRFDG